jgi:uncharacterized NAD(P)/FAD-binding protein YdhS
MPYSGEDNSRLMLANIASIEIPPIFITYLDWLKNQPEAHLTRFDIRKSSPRPTILAPNSVGGILP